MRRNIFIILLISAGPFIFWDRPGTAQRTKSSQSAGEQVHAEKGLKDNRYFFYFINSSVSNFGTPEDKKLYKEAIQRDIIAQQLYMKFLFHDAYQEVRRSQKILVDLYQKLLIRDIAAAKKLLNGFAPLVVRTHNHRARHYLHLGYRDTTLSRIDMVMADNYRETLYSMRLYKYVRAIKKAKHGKRYAFLALLVVKSPPDAKRSLRFVGFDRLKGLIEKASSDEKQKKSYERIHLDNYYRTRGKSFYDIIWEKPELTEIKEYAGYLQKQ